MTQLVLKHENIGESIHSTEGQGDRNEHNPPIQHLKVQEIYYFLHSGGQTFPASRWFCSRWCFRAPGSFSLEGLPALQVSSSPSWLLTGRLPPLGSRTQERGRKAGSYLQVSGQEGATPLQLTILWLKLTPTRLGRAVQLGPQFGWTAS